MKQEFLRLGDISVASALLLTPGVRLVELSRATERSLGEVHNALRRLRAARLLRPDAREVEPEPFLRFVRWGAPYAFPPALGPMARGFATALPLPWEGGNEPVEAEFVWPDASGPTRGQAFAPPYSAAVRLAARNPALRAMLAAIDLARVGGVREQDLAMDVIERQIAGRR